MLKWDVTKNISPLCERRELAGERHATTHRSGNGLSDVGSSSAACLLQLPQCGKRPKRLEVQLRLNKISPENQLWFWGSSDLPAKMTNLLHLHFSSSLPVVLWILTYSVSYDQESIVLVKTMEDKTNKWEIADLYLTTWITTPVQAFHTWLSPPSGDNEVVPLVIDRREMSLKWWRVTRVCRLLWWERSGAL